MQRGAATSNKMNRLIVHIPSAISRRPPSKSYLNLSENFYMGIGLVIFGIAFSMSVVVFFGFVHPSWCASHHYVEDCYSPSTGTYLLLLAVFLPAMYLTTKVTLSDPGYLSAGEVQDFREVHGAVAPKGHSEDGLPTELSVLRCSSCNVFIRGFDHHCHIIGACVGRRNYGLFLSFLVVDLALATTIFGMYLAFAVAGVRGTSPSAQGAFYNAFPSWPASNTRSILHFLWEAANVVSPISWSGKDLNVMPRPNVTIVVVGLLVGVYLILFVVGVCFTYFRLALLGHETVEARLCDKLAKARSSTAAAISEDRKSVAEKEIDCIIAKAPPSHWLLQRAVVKISFRQLFAMMKDSVLTSRLFWSTVDGEPCL